MKECSLITVVNNESLYYSFLDSLNTQINVDYEVIPVWNPDNKLFDSAREALGSGTNKAEGRYLIFLHPDIRFLTSTTLYEILEWVKKLGAFGVIGVAGCPDFLIEGDRVIYSSIVHGDKKKPVGKIVQTPENVQTVDECFFIQTKEYFDQVGFTQKKGWHLYAVEQCLRAEQDGATNYVVPAKLWHLSEGKSLDPSYVIQLSVLCKEYANKYDYINTTVKKWKTKGFLSEIYRAYYYCKQIIKRKLVRST